MKIWQWPGCRNEPGGVSFLREVQDVRNRPLIGLTLPFDGLRMIGITNHHQPFGLSLSKPTRRSRLTARASRLTMLSPIRIHDVLDPVLAKLQRIEWAARMACCDLDHMRIDHGRAHVAVAEQ